jgi:hypothetical protein
MRNYVLRIIANFENETKLNVITRNFQLNETGEITARFKRGVLREGSPCLIHPPTLIHNNPAHS